MGGRSWPTQKLPQENQLNNLAECLPELYISVTEDLTEQFNLTLLFSKLKDVTIPMLLIFTSANELLTCTKLPTQQKAPPEPFGDVLPLHTVTPELFVLSSRETFLQRALVPSQSYALPKSYLILHK